MRLVFNRDILLSALEKICSVAGGKSTFAILSSFLIEVKNGVCTFTATDLTDIVQLVVEAQVDDDCAFLLKAKETLEIIKGLPKGEITFELTESAIKISSGKFKANMNIADRSEFPNVVISDVKAGLKFKSSELKNALSQVSQFVSTDNSRPEFCGVHLDHKFENKEAVVTMVSTDGHRLAKAELSAEDMNGLDANSDGYILSTKAVTMLSKFFSEEESVLFSLEKKKSEGNKAIFKGDKITVVSSLISGRFPDFSAVIPQTFKSFVVDKNLLIASLKRSSLFNPKQPLVRIKLSENNVNICSSGQMGSMSDDVECKYIGEEIIIGLNAKYLQESLSIVDDLFAVVGVVDPDSPIVVMSETDFDAKNFGTLSVIMPMMI
jgi:DNA polymerase-3 subunit beta